MSVSLTFGNLQLQGLCREHAEALLLALLLAEKHFIAIKNMQLVPSSKFSVLLKCIETKKLSHTSASTTGARPTSPPTVITTAM
jgi:hypothetical protein